MFIEHNLNSEKDVTIPASVWSVIQRQAQSLSSRDRQIEDLIALLKEQVQENKKISARQDALATSVVAG